MNYRSLHAADIAEAEEASLDYYVFVRNAYIQQRRALIRGDKGSRSSGAEAPEVDGLYELDD